MGSNPIGGFFPQSDKHHLCYAMSCKTTLPRRCHKLHLDVIKNGEAGHRSQCLSHAKRALYHLSYIPMPVHQEDPRCQDLCTPAPDPGMSTCQHGLQQLCRNLPERIHRPWQVQQKRSTKRKKKCAHAGSRTRVTSMGGLYDAVTLHALLLKASPPLLSSDPGHDGAE